MDGEIVAVGCSTCGDALLFYIAQGFERTDRTARLPGHDATIESTVKCLP